MVENSQHLACPEGLIINSVNFPVQAYIRGTVSGPLGLARKDLTGGGGGGQDGNTLQWQQMWKQVEACRRYGSRQRLAAVMDAVRGLQEYGSRYRGLQEVWK